eukprot:gene3632-6448_t
MLGLLGGNKTFKQKKFTGNTNIKVTYDTLDAGDLSLAVKLPPGESLNEWLAVNTVEFYGTTNLLYGCISEFCSEQSCPAMSAGDKYIYLWKDPESIKYKKAAQVTAPEYVACLMDWIEQLLNDPEVFPTDVSKFSKNFKNVVKKIFNRMFRVYAHLYYSHFVEIVELGIDEHLNTAFKHFMLFVNEFDLVEKTEQAPLKTIIADLL